MEENLGSYNDNPVNELSQLLASYSEALKTLETSTSLSSKQILSLLRLRDRIQIAINSDAQISDADLARVVELDTQLKQNASVICKNEHLAQLRQSLQPIESFWWWYLDPPKNVESFASKFDWLWNVGTVACLVVSTSFMTQTAQAFSTQGFDFLGVVSTIGQGTGLAFVVGGALTDRGKKAVSKTLLNIKIPPSLHAEVTFATSLALLGISYGINHNLPLVGHWYFEQAQRHESRGEWSQAFSSYERALNFDPDDYRTQIATGFLHEKLGNFDKAIEEYDKGAAFGLTEFINAKARAILMSALQENNWEGGLEPALIQEAEDLLELAETSLRSDQSVFSLQDKGNQRLKADIKINQAIAHLAKTSFSEGSRDASSRLALKEDIVIKLLELAQFELLPETRNKYPLTEASTLGKIRASCFYQAAFSASRFHTIPDTTRGIDYLINSDDFHYACMPIRFAKALSTTPDAFLLRKYNFGRKVLEENEATDPEQQFKNNFKHEFSFLNLVYGDIFSDELDSDLILRTHQLITLSKSLKTWIESANKIRQMIVNHPIDDYEQDQQIIWRLLLDKKGRIISYFAYDETSRNIGNSQPFIKDFFENRVIEKVGAELLNNQSIEFTDFKVVLSNKGKLLHVLPWPVAYPSMFMFGKCDSDTLRTCEILSINPSVNAAFEDYTPDLTDRAELGALEGAVSWNLASVPLTVDNIRKYYEEGPAVFKLKVSSDGQIVNYRAMNRVARSELSSQLPFVQFTTPQYPDLEKPPYVYLKFEMQGLLANRLSAWEKEK